MADLKGKVAIVTGAGHGIGREIALSLARNGADVVVTDISDAVFEVGKQVEALGSKALSIKCDVSDYEQAKGAEEKILEKFERIDVLVNNAGIYPQKAFLDMTVDDWNNVLRVNLNGTFHCTSAVIPKMVKQRYGKIVNIASIAGAVVGFQNLVHYSASKAAIAGFTKSLALEVAQYGINVNAVAPGPIDVGDMAANTEMYQQIIKAIPVGRMGLPIDIANLVVFLVSDESNFITGQCIVSDGGYTLP
ncbi:SDR family oxidoreductase [Candidatus Bathyarchaeota archaeon]|nr:SDR family oxidoreductase [Candidatus Bathyarchaeota archaeon]